jgi:hypothetical protein
MRLDRRPVQVAFVALVLALAAGAQQDAHAAGPAARSARTIQAASATQVVSASLRAVAITAENAAAIEAALEAIHRPGYKCPSCGYVEAAGGRCEPCKQELRFEVRASMALRDARIDLESGTIAISVVPGQAIRLSEIERCLAVLQAKIERDSLSIAGWTVLVIDGGSSPGAAAGLQKALLDSVGFDAVEVAPAELARALLARVKPTAAMTLTAASQAVAAHDSALRVSDVVWVGACRVCREKEPQQAACADCTRVKI